MIHWLFLEFLVVIPSLDHWMSFGQIFAMALIWVQVIIEDINRVSDYSKYIVFCSIKCYTFLFMLAFPYVYSRLGKIPDIELFDSEFFKIPTNIAVNIVPPIRILHEIIYETFIDAGKFLCTNWSFFNMILLQIFMNELRKSK